MSYYKLQPGDKIRLKPSIVEDDMSMGSIGEVGTVVGYRNEYVLFTLNITSGNDLHHWEAHRENVVWLKSYIAPPPPPTPVLPTKPTGRVSLDQSVQYAIDYIKACPLKGRYVKVELEGHCNRRSPDAVCKAYMLSNVSAEARESLVYSKFYNDGSVDSEFTFTLPIDKARLVPEFIVAFKKLALSMGKLDVEGSGMHIAILNSPTGNYPDTNTLSSDCLRNFRATLNRLMPSLFFLASAGEQSRPLHFRYPSVSSEKYSAVNTGNGVLEYRVFETCYDRPEAFLDFLCVIANTLQFYKPEPTTFDFFGKIGELRMPEEGYDLTRFYSTSKHIDALEAGVNVLKPLHKTYDQLKLERKFSVDKGYLRRKQEEIEQRIEREWQELADRLPDELKGRKACWAAQYNAELAYWGKTDCERKHGKKSEFITRKLENEQLRYEKARWVQDKRTQYNKINAVCATVVV